MNTYTKSTLQKIIQKIPYGTTLAIYGYGITGKFVENYILENRKDLQIKYIVDDNSSHKDVLSLDKVKDIKGIKEVLFLIAAEEKTLIEKMAKKLAKFNLKYDKTYYKNRQYDILKSIAKMPILPIAMIYTTLSSFIRVFRALIKYDWKYLSGHHQNNALNNFFYYIQDYIIQKKGRYNTTSLVAGGDFSLKNWFHATPFSLRLQSSLGTVLLMFIAMCFWIGFFVYFFHEVDFFWFILVAVFFSTLFFAVFFEIQNYNILGWILYPPLLWAIITQDYLLLLIVLICITFVSFTASFVAFILTFTASVYYQDIYIVLVAIPALIKWSVPVIISFQEGALKKMGGSLGIHEKVKYERKVHKKITFNKLYLFSIMGQFAIYAVLYSQFSLLSLFIAICVLLFITNEILMRFADQQSFYLCFLTMASFFMFHVEFNWGLFLSFLISIYPIYGLMLNVMPNSNFITPMIAKPYNSRKIINGLCILFSTIPRGEKLLVAYKNPNKRYNNIFNGTRIFNEPLQYSAVINEISLFPDWYMVMENNKEKSDESFWIKDAKYAERYMKKHNISYILVPDFYDDNWNRFEMLGDYTFELEKGCHYRSKYMIRLYKLHNDDKNNCFKD